MSDKTSFYYDPIRQGYDSNSWRTLSGAPAVVAGGRLSVVISGTAGSAIHYADILKGDISFNVNSSAPGANTGHIFGVSSPDTLAYIRFNIGNVLTCETSDGVTSTASSTIGWNTDWSGANVVFRIRWEAGRVVFTINGVQVYTASDASVPAGPLSLYLQDDSSAPMTVGDITVRGTQSFVMNPKTSDTTSFDGLLALSQAVTVSENLVIFSNIIIPKMNDGTLFEGVTITENFAVAMVTKTSVNDTVTITENLALIKI